jgi:hypothetical protein
MLSRIAWGFCNLAFDASRDECFPDLMRGFFRRLGVAWYWAALALDGRAFDVWRDLRARPAAGLAGPIGMRAARTAARTIGAACRSVADARRSAPLRVRALLSGPSRGEAAECPSVPAWSLPQVTRIANLGLGRVWVVLCPYCNEFHMHAPGEGRRAAPCALAGAVEAYELVYSGELPCGLRNRFHRAVRQDLPKLLFEWQQRADAPIRLEAA